MAYQLDRPDRQDGLVVVLRRPQSPYLTARLPLRGLEADATYQVTNLDTGAEEDEGGSRLLESGLRVTIDQRPGSALIRYRRQ